MVLQQRYGLTLLSVEKKTNIGQDDVSVPIYLFISPELPVNGWGIFVRQNDITSKDVKDRLAEGLRVPPRYCREDFGVEGYAMPVGTPPPAYSEW
jgi:hypothetical protein